MGAGLAAGAVATRAGDRQAHLDVGGGAERGLRQLELDHHLGVGRAHRPRAATPPEGVAAEERIEQVSEAERIAGRSARTGARRRP